MNEECTKKYIAKYAFSKFFYSFLHSSFAFFSSKFHSLSFIHLKNHSKRLIGKWKIEQPIHGGHHSKLIRINHPTILFFLIFFLWKRSYKKTARSCDERQHWKKFENIWKKDFYKILIDSKVKVEVLDVTFNWEYSQYLQLSELIFFFLFWRVNISVLF